MLHSNSNRANPHFLLILLLSFLLDDWLNRFDVLLSESNCVSQFVVFQMVGPLRQLPCFPTRLRPQQVPTVMPMIELLPRLINNSNHLANIPNDFTQE